MCCFSEIGKNYLVEIQHINIEKDQNRMSSWEGLRHLPTSLPFSSTSSEPYVQLRRIKTELTLNVGKSDTLSEPYVQLRRIKTYSQTLCIQRHVYQNRMSSWVGLRLFRVWDSFILHYQNRMSSWEGLRQPGWELGVNAYTIRTVCPVEKD